MGRTSASKPFAVQKIIQRRPKPRTASRSPAQAAAMQEDTTPITPTTPTTPATPATPATPMCSQSSTFRPSLCTPDVSDRATNDTSVERPRVDDSSNVLAALLAKLGHPMLPQHASPRSTETTSDNMRTGRTMRSSKTVNTSKPRKPSREARMKVLDWAEAQLADMHRYDIAHNKIAYDYPDSTDEPFAAFADFQHGDTLPFWMHYSDDILVRQGVIDNETLYATAAAYEDCSRSEGGIGSSDGQGSRDAVSAGISECIKEIEAIIYDCRVDVVARKQFFRDVEKVYAKERRMKEASAKKRREKAERAASKTDKGAEADKGESAKVAVEKDKARDEKAGRGTAGDAGEQDDGDGVDHTGKFAYEEDSARFTRDCSDSSQYADFDDYEREEEDEDERESDDGEVVDVDKVERL